MNSKKSDSESKKRVDDIFYDLRIVKKLVNEKHELVSGDSFESQRLWITKKKWIKYPEERLEKKHLSDDALRWALLHEEGHLSEHKGHHYFAWLVIISVLSLWLFFSIYLPTISFNITFSYTLCNYLLSAFESMVRYFIAIVIAIAIVILMPHMFYDNFLKNVESNCDRTAAKKMKNIYGVKNPSLLAQEIYDWLKDTAEEKKKEEHWFIKFLKDCFDYHPPWCERIEKLKDLDEDV